MAMHVSRNDRQLGGNLVEINVTPLVDVMLVLLIIFMVTAPLMSQGIDVDLPSASTQAIKTEKDDVVLTVLKNGSLFVQGDKKTSFRVEELAPKLMPLYEGKTKKEIFLRADKSVPYGVVVQVMAACKNAGIERIGMVTEPEAQPTVTP